MATPNEPGWYDDPQDPNAQRYWDGQHWTSHQQRRPNAPAPRPPVMPPRQQQPAAPPPSAAPTQAVPRSQPPPLPPRAPAPTQPVQSPTPPPPPPNRPPPPGHSAPGAPPPGPPGQPQPPPRQWSSGDPEPPDAGAPPASDALATVRSAAAKVSVTAWIVLGGLIATVISIFLPFATVSIKLFGHTLDSREVSATGEAKFVVVVLAAIAVGLALPALTGSSMPVARLIGLSAVVGLLGALTFVWFYTVSKENRKGEGFANVTPSYGLMVYAVAVIVTAVGVARLWLEYSKAHKQTQ